MTEIEVATEVDVVTQSVLKEEEKKVEVATKSYVAKEIYVATKHLCRDKNNSFKRVVRSRQLNNVMKCLVSQPDDNLSSHRLIMSRQTILCCDIRESLPAGQILILP